MPKLGSKVGRDHKGTISHAPVVFAVQPEFFIRLESAEDVKQWEADLRSFYGVNIRGDGLVGVSTESCSGGCSDDCDMG